MESTDLKYAIIIYWSDEDEAFIAEMPELAGCAADGRSPQDALHALHSVAREWIVTAREMGRNIPEPKGRPPFV
ncbi:MAG TPA: type II toxin-antitoxin system HicB family antitoxin [Nitrolancea sp.]|nr:type II toxin-antitoxin system HicB family antitoxin [Nitrolancea sp.]